ncbi:MAG: hypothetical protein KJ621_21180, partial [Proteobacteria bacterium]|nr:hypothetical protein [Pseudomonadota bacterium]
MPEHAGPILIRAFGTSSGYLDLATGQPVYFTGDDELVAYLDYDGHSGAIYQDISVNALTTLATHLGLVYQAGGQTLGAAMTRAYQLFGKHLERTTNPNGVDIARTSVSNLSTGSSSDPPKSIFMGLFHIGLSRWGAWAATSQGLARTALPCLEVIKLIERDLSSGVLSGRDEFGAPIYATPNQAVSLVTNTLRIELAREISRWLASMPLPDASVTANPTSLRPSNFTVAGGFFDALALDTSELFSAFDPTVSVDAAAPSISFVSPTGGSDVAGAVTISVTASDNEGVYSLQFAGGQDWITGRSSSVSGTSGHLIGQLDATQLPEGPLTLTAVGLDLFGNSQQASIAVNVVTIPDGTIGGRVFLDTPVSNVNVEALDFTGGVRGAVLDSMTAQDGSFSLQIPFTHDGPVLIRAFGTASTYKNMALNLPQTFTSSDELTLVVNYGSAGDGTNLAGRSVNAITTMATRFIERKVATGALGLDEAISLAFQLLGSHLDRPGTAPYGLNVSTTTVSDFSGNPTSDTTESILLGLTHVGLSRWGADIALSQNLARSSLPPTAILKLFLRDLENMVLDGKDGSGATIYATPNQAVALDSYTLRNAIAQSVAVWLDNVPLADGTPGQNSTALRAANFATEQGFFDDLCMDDSALFPPTSQHQLVPFDRNPPVVTITAPTGNPLSPADFNVLAEAVDTSAIRSFSAIIVG